MKLVKIIQKSAAVIDLADSLQLIVEELCQALQVDACSIFLTNEERGEYVLSATSGLNPQLVGKASLKFGQGLVGWVAEKEASVNVERAPKHPEFYRYPELGEEKYHGFLGVPIIEQAELLGVVVLQQKAAERFSEEQVAQLTTLSVQLAEKLAAAHARGSVKALQQKRGSKKTKQIEGVAGAQGVVIGKAVLVYPPADLNAVPERPVEDVKAEIRAFENALKAVRKEIQAIGERAKSSLSDSDALLFDAYLNILDSKTLLKEIKVEIRGGCWAQTALQRIIKRHIAQFESLEDEYLQERAADFRDLGRRILGKLQQHERQAPNYPKSTILVSEEVTATALMEVPEGCLQGIVSASGSRNSHVAILARALGVPTVMGARGVALADLDGKEVILDGYSGHVYLQPSAALKKEFSSLALEERQLDTELEGLRDLPAITQDNHRIALYVNTGLAADLGSSLSVGAEGVGLYRTELPFMVRDRFPSEEEQCIMYKQLLNAFSPRPVIMRTLDIGGDKALPYFSIDEENPFLGWRGIRISLDHPEIFLQQVRAMLLASRELNNLSLMLPMITSVSEVEAAKQLIKQVHEELVQVHPEIQLPLIGLMIEVPAAVYQTRELAKRADFLSIGSNDLIQYLLAVDRNNARVAPLYDGLHPAVLRALKQVVDGAHKENKPVGICGELAGDPLAVILLLGMKFDSLSVNARALPRIKWIIKNFTLEQAQGLVKEVLQMDDPKEVRGHMEMALDEIGLGGLIRAGKH